MRTAVTVLTASLMAALLLVLPSCARKSVADADPIVTPTVNGEVEATQFLGQVLTPIRFQRNNGLKGAQYIDRSTYTLTVDGLVDRPLKLNYDDLLAYPQTSKLMDLNCVEGWDFIAKWTGPALSVILDQARVRPEATVMIFHSVDVPDKGYTSLATSFIRDRNIIIALKLNDLTLPPGRGFPFQVVAETKYGYKWAKWVTRIELSADTDFQGFWEGYGYNNNGDISGLTLGTARPLLQSFPVAGK